MTNNKSNKFLFKSKDSNSKTNITHEENTLYEKNKQLKKELLEVFHKFGYLKENNDYEVRLKITSRNIAWININRMEIIK
jgi:hypothetical protein